MNSSVECDNNSTFSKDQVNALLLSLSCSGGVSMIFSAFTLVFAFCRKVYKNFYYRLAIYQVVSSFCLSVVTYLLLVSYNHSQEGLYHVESCKIMGFLLQYVLWVKLMLINFFTFYFFSYAIFLHDLRRFEGLCVLLSFFLPACICWIPFIHDSYGISGAWCWIRTWKDECATQKYFEGIAYQFGLWYGPLFLCLTVNTILAILVLAVFSKRWLAKKENLKTYSQIAGGSKLQNKKALNQLLPLLAYPIIFYILTLFPLFNRIHGAIKQEPSFSLDFAHGLIAGSWSFFSSIALLMHMLVMEKCTSRQKVRPLAPQHDQDPFKTTCDGSFVGKYEDYATISTNAITVYEPPNESSIDNINFNFVDWFNL